MYEKLIEFNKIYQIYYSQLTNRLNRSLKDYRKIIDEIKFAGIEFININDGMSELAKHYTRKYFKTKEGLK